MELDRLEQKPLRRGAMGLESLAVIALRFEGLAEARFKIGDTSSSPLCKIYIESRFY